MKCPQLTVMFRNVYNIALLSHNQTVQSISVIMLKGRVHTQNYRERTTPVPEPPVLDPWVQRSLDDVFRRSPIG